MKTEHLVKMRLLHVDFYMYCLLQPIKIFHNKSFYWTCFCMNTLCSANSFVIIRNKKIYRDISKFNYVFRFIDKSLMKFLRQEP